MSIKLSCNLCCTPSSEYKSLENKKGETSEIYEITVKYFDPTLLRAENNAQLSEENKILCLNCWVKIKEFYEFQQNVLETRTLLEKASIVKSEYEIHEQHINVKLEDDTVFQNCIDTDDKKWEINIKSETDEFDKTSTFSNDVDDENPFTTYENATTFLVNENSMEADTENEKLLVEGTNNKKHQITSNEKHTVIAAQAKDTHSHKNDTKTANKMLTKKDKSARTTFNLNMGQESDELIRKWKPTLECDLCEESASNFENLRAHFREKHKCNPYIKCCDRKFCFRHKLVKHIKLHQNPDTHKCEICGTVFLTNYTLKIHKKSRHGEIEQYKCEICHKLFTLKASLDRHLQTHTTGDKDFVCQECGRGYVLEAQLKSHIKALHASERTCAHCGKNFRNIYAFRKHLMEHKNNGKRKFPCAECGHELKTSLGLKRHMIAYHNDGSTIYVCGICGKISPHELALRTHKRNVHELLPKHKCTYCDKAFKRPEALKEHITIHTGQRLYQCPYCPRSFKVNANFYVHRKKAHPLEWEEGRKNRLQKPKVDINHVRNKIVM